MRATHFEDSPADDTFMPKPKPAHEVRLGSVKAAIWKNDTDNGVRYKTTFSRLYKDGEEWKNTDSFGRDDLLVLAKLADQAHSWIHEQSQEEKKGDEISFRVTGHTVDIQAITRFMRDLALSPFVGAIDLEPVTTGNDQGKEMWQFTLAVKYRRPDSTALRRLPLVVTVR